VGRLTHGTFRQLVADEWETLTIPAGPPRRDYADQYADQMTDYVQENLVAVDSLVSEGSYDLFTATSSITDLAMELTSFLYAAGADHRIWRRWAAVTALGLFLNRHFYDAAVFATIAGEWELLATLPSVPLDSKQVSDQVLWNLVTGNPVEDLLEDTNDEMADVDLAWMELARSIPAQEHETTESALKIIADYWMEESDWTSFVFGQYPMFEGPSCAAAAIARHYGFIPTSMTVDQQRFLEPGLAIPEPPPLVSTRFSLRSSLGESEG
jgi:hypothetical protein